MEETKVLVIEDSDVVRFLCSAVLTEMGLKPSLAPASNLGLAEGELLCSRPTIVLLHLEGEIGREVTCRGKELLPYVPEGAKVVDTGELRGREVLTRADVIRALELFVADLQRALGQKPEFSFTS